MAMKQYILLLWRSAFSECWINRIHSRRNCNGVTCVAASDNAPKLAIGPASVGGMLSASAAVIHVQAAACWSRALLGTKLSREMCMPAVPWHFVPPNIQHSCFTYAYTMCILRVSTKILWEDNLNWVFCFRSLILYTRTLKWRLGKRSFSEQTNQLCNILDDSTSRQECHTLPRTRGNGLNFLQHQASLCGGLKTLHTVLWPPQIPVWAAIWKLCTLVQSVRRLKTPVWSHRLHGAVTAWLTCV